MSRISLELEIITPLLLGGSDPRSDPELRSAPFRGQLRYWLRALSAKSAGKLYPYESDLMGDTRYGSSVVVQAQLLPGKPLTIVSRELLLHLEEQARQSAYGFKEGGAFQLSLSSRPLLAGGLPVDIPRAADLWLALGGAGKRSRRGMGSLQRTDRTPADGERLADQIGMLLQSSQLSFNRRDHPGDVFPGDFCDTPFDYPAFYPGCWLVLVCREGFPSYTEALYDFWAQHRGAEPFKNYPVAYGYIKRDLRRVQRDDPDRPQSGDRRASPFHLHIAKSSAGWNGKPGYHMVLTAFHAKPTPSTDSWEHVQELMSELWQMHQGALFYAPCNGEEGKE